MADGCIHGGASQDPKSVNHELESSEPARTSGTSVQEGLNAALLGALGFGAVSIVVYGTVAFAGKWLYRNLTEAGAYSFWAALYLLGAPWLLGRLLVAAPTRRRYGVAFVAGFLAYSVGWVTAYFPLRNKPGEVLASILGPALFAAVMCAAFRRWPTWVSTTAVLVVGHGLGYFAGDYLNTALGGPVGMVMWGVCHGLGYGAAIGWATRVWTAGAGGTADVPSRVGA